MDDKEIIHLFNLRDERALYMIKRKYGAYCGSIVKGLLRDRQDEEECLNDLYLALWNTIPPQNPEHLKLYAGKLARRIAISKLRKRMANKRGAGELPFVLEELEEVLSGDQSTERTVEEHLLTETINRFLYQLQPDDRHIFLLRYWHIQSIRSIALQFHCAQGTIKSRLFRMRCKLRDYLEKEDMV